MVQTGTSWVIKRLKILRDAALKSRLQTMVVADIANLSGALQRAQSL